MNGNNCIIQGAGKDITILKALQNNNQILVTLGGDPNGAPYSAIRDLTIDMSPAIGGPYALSLWKSSFSEASNVHILNPYNIGIGIHFSQYVRIHDSIVEHVAGGYSISQGIAMDSTNCSGTNCTGTTISHCSVFNTGLDAIQIAGSAATVDSCYVSGTNPAAPKAGIYVAQGARKCIVANNIINSCGTGVDVSSGVTSGSGGGPDSSEGMIVEANNCSNNRGSGISTASNGTVITGNICRDNNTTPNNVRSAGIGVVGAKNVLISENFTGNSVGSATPQNSGIVFWERRHRG